MGVLAVEVDQGLAQRRQLAGGGQPPVDVGAAAARAGHGPGHHHLGGLVAVAVGGAHEAPLDPRLVGPRCARAAGRPGPPTSSSMASTTMVLPAPVSPVTAVMPGPRTRRSSAMTPRSRTASSTSAASPHRSLNPNLAFRMRRKSRGPKVTNRADSDAAVQVTASPRRSVPRLCPSTDSVAERSPTTSMRTRGGGQHERAVEQHVGRDRGHQQAAMGGLDDRSPRREAYAVDPVGVATIKPSAA